MDKYTIDISLINNNYRLALIGLSGGQIDLINPKITTTQDGASRIVGKTKLPWVKPEIGLDLSEVTITVVEFENRFTIETISAFQANQNTYWNAVGTPIGSLILSTEHFDSFPLSEKQLSEKINLVGFTSFLNFFGFEKFNYRLHLKGFDNLTLDYLWASESNVAITFGNDFFTVDNFKLNGVVSQSTELEIGGHGHQSVMQLSADVELAGIKANVALMVNNDDHYNINIQPDDPNLVSNFSKLLSIFKLDHFRTASSVFEQEFDLLKSIELRRVLLRVSQKNLAEVRQITLFNRINALGGSFDLILQYANDQFEIQISLNQDTPIKLNDLLVNLSQEMIHLPLETTISAFALRGTFNPLSYRFTISLNDLWTFPIGKKSIDLSRVSFDIHRKSAATFNFWAQGNFSIANVDLTLTAQKITADNHNESGWLFSTEIAHKTEIHLNELISDLDAYLNFPTPTHIPDVIIKEIDLSFHTGTHQFEFHSVVGLNSAIGPFKKGNLEVSISLAKNESGSHDFNMDLNGFVEINEIHVDFSAANIGQTNWNASISYNEDRHDGILTLENICQHFDPDFKIANEELASLALSHFEIEYAHSANGDHTLYAELKLTTKNGTEIEGFFSGHHAENKWNIAAGIGYKEGDHENTPEIINSASTHFTLESIWIVFISSSGSWPKLPDSFPETIKDQEVTTGLGIVAKIDLDQHDFVGINELTKRGHTVLDIFAEVTNNGLRVEADLEGEFRIKTGEKSDIVIQRASLVFMLGTTVALIIKGKFDIHIDGFEQTLEVGLVIEETGFELFADLKFSGEGWAPFGLKGMHIDELAFELGVDFLPPEVRVGFMGFSHIGEIMPPNELKDVQDEFAMILGFSSEIPNPEYFALKITKLGLSDLLELFPGTSAHGHSIISDTTFSIKDFELIWCEKPMILPNGKSAEIGFSCHGLVTIFGWRAYASLEIHPESGIQGLAMLDKLTLGPLHLTGNSPGLKLPKGTSNIQVTSLPSADNPPTFPEDELEIIIKPGGAMIQFNSASSPHLNVSFKLSLLGVEVAHLDAEITNEKVVFDFALNLIVLSIGVKCKLEKRDTPYFNISGNFFLGVDFHLKIDFAFVHIDEHVVAGIGADIHLIEDNGKFTIGFKGNANFFGHQVKMDEIGFTEDIGDLKSIPGKLMDFIKTGHGSKFSQEVKNASGHNNGTNSASERNKNAKTLLEMAIEWAQFVHDDIASLHLEEQLSPDQIATVIAGITENIKTIKLGIGGYDIDRVSENHVEHLDKLQTLNQDIDAKDADQARADEITQMELDMLWINDASSVLRDKIKAIWNDSEPEIRALEEAVIAAQEQYVNNKITEDALLKVQNDRDLIFESIKLKAAQLVDKSGKPYPPVAVQHHLLIIELQQRATLVSEEILTIAQHHADSIRTGGIRPEDQESFILNPLTHE